MKDKFFYKVQAAIHLMNEYPGYVQTLPDDQIITALNLYLRRMDGH